MQLLALLIDKELESNGYDHQDDNGISFCAAPLISVNIVQTIWKL